MIPRFHATSESVTCCFTTMRQFNCEASPNERFKSKARREQCEAFFETMNDPWTDRSDMSDLPKHERLRMNNAFLVNLFDWDKFDTAKCRGLRNVLRWLGVKWRLMRSTDDGFSEMITLEQRMNLFHLLNGVMDFAVPGHVVEVGCFEGKTAALMRTIMNLHAPVRELHVYDSFKKRFHLAEDVHARLLRHFANLGLQSPIVHIGNFSETLVAELPDKICFAHLDFGYGAKAETHRANVQFCLEQLYPRLSFGGVCLVMDYFNPRCPGGLDANPATRAACDEFLADKPEEMFGLYGGEYSHAYFRKLPLAPELKAT